MTVGQTRVRGFYKEGNYNMALRWRGGEKEGVGADTKLINDERPSITSQRTWPVPATRASRSPSPSFRSTNTSMHERVVIYCWDMDRTDRHPSPGFSFGATGLNFRNSVSEIRMALFLDF